MTVAQLIEILQKQPPDAKVLLEDKGWILLNGNWNIIVSYSELDCLPKILTGEIHGKTYLPS